MRSFAKGFFWGPPSHKPVAWVATLAGVIVMVLPLVIALFGTGGHPAFLLAIFFVGLVETGWAVELLPRHWYALTGWGRFARWMAAVVGLLLAVLSVVDGLAPIWFAGIIAVTALLLVVEMAPSGFANRP
jgi:hypothetical protein